MNENIPQNTTDATLPQQNVEATLPQQPVETVQEESKEDPNWKAFREARKKDRAEKEAAEKRAAEKEAEAAALRAAMEAAFAKQQNVGLPHQEYRETSQEEYIEKRIQEAFVAREAAAERERSEREQREYPNKLMSAHPDFNHIVTDQNLDYLEYHYPEISGPLKHMKDGFDKWSYVYKAIKKFVPNADDNKRDSIKADINLTKPKSPSSTSITQPGGAGVDARLSEDRKAANWRRMQQEIKSLKT